ncbi:MAG: DUF5711 family protein [Lachnospiraceae bacterium]|nr:DUF5711 family protein [Lachnospiraceae bacterium]
MTDIGKNGIHAVEKDVEGMEKRIKAHRRKITLIIIIVIAVIALAVTGYYFYCNSKSYTDYMIKSTVERNDGTENYERVGDYILKYNNDGAALYDLKNNGIWNQAFEMQEPIVKINGNYVAIADREGTKVYIFDTVGAVGSVTTTTIIENISIAAQGTVALLTEEDGTSYIKLYDKTGENLASGAIHLTNGSFPVNLALSDDATKLGVSMIDISGGSVASTIAFYNFGSVGQSEIDNIVGSYTYDGSLLPEIFYVSNDKMIAIGDSMMVVYNGDQRPEETSVVAIDGEACTVFHDDKYIGLIYENEDSEEDVLKIYNMDGEAELEMNVAAGFEKVYFLQNHEICMLSDSRAYIYTLKGITKFYYNFDDMIYYIFSGTGWLDYSLVLKGFTENIILK